MEMKEVSKIEIKAFSLDAIQNVTNTREFDKCTLHKKLKLLEGTRSTFSWEDDAIHLGDAFERALNELFDGRGEIALIVEKRVITLHRE